MEITLNGKVALVTGGGAGIGRAIAEAFLALGSRVVVADNDVRKIEPLQRELGENALVVRADVTVAADVATVMQAVGDRFGKLDILVNNAGHHLGLVRTLDETTDDDIARLFDINLRQIFVVTRAALPLMRRSGAGGSIINVSSIEAFRGNPYNAIYTAFKHGVTGFTRAMALELGPENIRVNGIAPETTETEQVPVGLMVKPEFSEQNRTLPLGRYGKPADHAGTAVYFATDMSAWVTGTTALVDGGGLAASGFQRMPNGKWTIGPLVSGEVFQV